MANEKAKGLKNLRKVRGSVPTHHCSNCKCSRYTDCDCKKKKEKKK